MRRLLLLLPLLIGISSCFPDLPDSREITNLRVIAIQSDPAVAIVNTFPAPVITVRALVVDPANESLEGDTHQWGFELGDDEFEGREQFEALLPEGPYGTELVIDLAVLFEAREGGWIPAVLPLSYVVSDDDEERRAVKLVPFLLPDLGGFGDDDDSAAAGDDDDSAEVLIAPTETELYNENPVITAIERVEGERWTPDGGLFSLDEALEVGAADNVDGLHLVVEYSDDGDLGDVGVQLYWTGGTPGLPPVEDDEDDPFGGRFGGGPGGRFGPGGDDGEVEGDGQLVREEADGRIEFGWTPAPDGSSGARLFVVLVDSQGGQTWQEIGAR